MLKTVVCGIGNRMRGDDAVGPLVIDELRGKTDAMLIDCGESPESYTGKIEKAKPGRIIIVDAVDMEKPPGTISAIDVMKIKGVVMSTHNIPMTLFLEYIQTRVKSEIVFIGIQPERIAFNRKPSLSCRKAVPRAAVKIQKLINQG